MTDPLLAQLAALKGATAPSLKAKWRALFDTEPPPYNRRFLESRLAYRIQELAYGGVKKENIHRLLVVAREKDGKNGGGSQNPPDHPPVSGGRLGSAGQGALRIATPIGAARA